MRVHHPAHPAYELHPQRDLLAPGADPNDLGCWVLPDTWGHDLEVGSRVDVAWAGHRDITAATVVGHHNHTGAAVVRPDALTVGGI